MTPRNTRIVAGCTTVLAVGLLLLFWWWSIRQGHSATPSYAQQTDALTDGQALAIKHCSVCHSVPSPDILHKRSWVPMLAYMGYRLGITDISYLPSQPPHVVPNVKTIQSILQRESAIPEHPTMGLEEWAMLRHYYVANAPDEPLPQQEKPSLNWNLPQFDIVESDYSVPRVLTTLVRIREATREVYIGDGAGQSVTVLGREGQVKSSPTRLAPGISPVDIEFEGTTAYIASIGDFGGSKASFDKPAFISSVELTDERIVPETSKVVLDSLFRLGDMAVADFNGDGRTDFAVCGFGGVFGSFSWFEAQEDGTFSEHVLLSLAGAVGVEATDFNADGRDDLMVLMSDANEGLHLFVNQGGGEFMHRLLFETGPEYGHTRFQLKDFNGDGLTDVVAANGDIVDLYNAPRNYHGIRIYLNRGDFEFEEAYFYPMYGAYDAKAADFDGDGDLDIAAIAFYPYYASDKWESFVYLENRGGLNFVPYTNERVMEGRWLTMDVGDLDGDGDPDVVLGAGYIPAGIPRKSLFDRQVRSGPHVLVLKNSKQQVDGG